jgi:hypothetical protein
MSYNVIKKMTYSATLDLSFLQYLCVEEVPYLGGNIFIYLFNRIWEVEILAIHVLKITISSRNCIGKSKTSKFFPK